MPPQLQQLLQNRNAVIAIAGVLILVIVLVIVFGVMGGKKEEGETTRKLKEEERVLVVANNIGRALEIQALMAREGITLIRTDVEGGKAELKFDENATTTDRDRALITLVQSGLMDKNVGLELFDKGDLTASREEKRIKLIRARNGELARLIRKIDPIQDCAVFISMPEPTLFKKDQMPVSATVQVTLAPGERLNRDKVRSIINLLVGSVENLEAENIALTDTNGNVYNSVLDPTDELMDRLEERDRYMEQKVRTQLDRLLGRDNYVVTVSTYLREAPRSEMALTYNADGTVLSKSSEFNENLNAEKGANAGVGGPVSSYLPEELDIGVGGGSEQDKRGYNRAAKERLYNTGKQQVTEDYAPGMIEDITVAVTLDSSAYPKGLTELEFKELVARSASPLVNPENVTIATRKVASMEPITPVKPEQPAGLEIPWWIWAVASIILFFIFLMLLKAVSKPAVDPVVLQQQQEEIRQLRELANNQTQQIMQTQQQAQQMIQAQQQQIAQLTSQQQQIPQVTQQAPMQTGTELKQTLAELQALLKQEEEDEDLGAEIKSWIEST